jgi:hypothetical protein
LGKQSLFIMRTIRNTQIHSVGRNSARPTQETHCVSATKPNRLMLSRETVDVYCENHMEHTDTLCVRRMQSFNVTPTTIQSHNASLSRNTGANNSRPCSALYLQCNWNYLLHLRDFGITRSIKVVPVSHHAMKKFGDEAQHDHSWR